MIIDLKKLAQLEREFQNDHITLNALQNMVEIVTRSNSGEYNNSVNDFNAIWTLTELGVLKNNPENKNPDKQQLNS